MIFAEQIRGPHAYGKCNVNRGKRERWLLTTAVSASLVGAGIM